MRQNLLILFFSFLLQSSFAQSKFEIGAEGGFTNDKYKIKDPQHNLKTVSCIDGGGGVSFRYNAKKNFFYEASLLFRESAFGYKFKDAVGEWQVNAGEFLSIPLRVGYSLRIAKDFLISPVAGIAPFYRLDNGLPAGETFANYPSKFQSSFTPRDVEKRFFVSAQTGISVDFIIAQRIRLSMNPNYYWGTSKVSIYDISYTNVSNPGSAPVNAEIDGYGSYFNFNLGLKYLIYQRGK
jgi:hypothetical protein